jgi:hypothetical protein
MKQVLLSIALFILTTTSYAQSCTSTTYYDNMETYTWFGDWWLYNFSNFYTNFSVSPSVSAVHYGSGTGTSGIEQDWYTMPTITGLNPNYTYKVKFRLASYTITAPTATTRGVDAADYIQVQLSRNGGAYVTEMTIFGFNNQTWTYNATGIAAKTANGTNTNYQITVGGARTDGFSTVELTLQPGTTSVAIDLYMRCNSAGEEFWIDNVELIETIPTPSVTIGGTTSVCSGESTTLTATGAQTYSWNNGVSNGVSFVPTATTSYTVTGTNVGMVSGVGTTNTCSSTQSTTITVKPIPNIPNLSADTTLCYGEFAVLLAGSNIGTIQWYDALSGGNLLGTGTSYTTSPLLTNASFFAQSEALGCVSLRSQVDITIDGCILPIQLRSFTGENEGNTNTLYWVTDSEHNSSHFDVERSKNGIDFNYIGSIIADQNNPYMYVDETPYIGTNYYRLKMVDLDFTYDFSNIIAIDVEPLSNDFRVYPNPFGDIITYVYYEEVPEDLDIFIINDIGQEVYYKTVPCPGCYNVVHLDTHDILPGHYTLKILHKASNITRLIKIVK